MKSLSIVSLLWTVTILSALLANPALAADEDLPAPGGGIEEEIPLAPPPQDDLGEENLLPDPESGEEALPAPALDSQRESGRNQVNTVEEPDEIYLPTAVNQDNVNYAPLGSPVSSRGVGDADWRLGMDNRPTFSLHGGAAVFNYPTEAVEENRRAATVGASIRLLNIAQTVFLHAYGSFSWVKLGSVGPFSNVGDNVLHLGALLEIGIGRRISLFGSILRRSHTYNSDPGPSTTVETYASDISEDGIKLGLGVQYDFYVIPHGSLGIRAHVERDMGLVALTMALEPRPRKRLNLNFTD